MQVASKETVVIFSQDGGEYILEAADAFEREVAELGQSEKFMDFLAERSQEAGATSWEEMKHRLAQTD
ncbi:hypothetical protein [Synechococcus sp. PCC 7336]|uniref:hypothetical protein n=1 Tax=Synechococcus sp. PCC 7336 TaxID=195250 RepID=UPI0012EA3EFD|nr:hypothetical protein [Synechococcus sp. PCC 7336]